jgi:hypothetical protein
MLPRPLLAAGVPRARETWPVLLTTSDLGREAPVAIPVWSQQL